MATRYYGVFDANGLPQAFYVDDVYPPQEDGTLNDAIPVEAVEIGKDEWEELLSGQPLARYVDEAVTYVDAPPPPPPAPPTTEQQLLYEHENRILGLEGKPPVSIADFLKKVAA